MIILGKTCKLFSCSNNRINTDAAKKLGQAIGKNVGLETLLVGDISDIHQSTQI